MNRINSFLILILLFAFTGCNNSDSYDSVEQETPSETAILLNCDNTFSAMVSTRAAIDNAEDMSEGKIGIYCVARAKTGITGSQHAPEPDWNVVLDKANYGTTTNGIYWENVCCTVESGATGYPKLEVEPGQDHFWYYPITSWYAYDFYGYHPYSEDCVRTADSIYVEYETDGTKDLICGRSEDKSGEANGKYAYSARYMRTSGDSIVHMKFNHCLTQFRFHAIPVADSETGNFEDVKKLAVKEIRMHDMPKNLRMTVVDRDNASAAGNIVPIGGETIDYVLKETNGNDLSAVAISTQSVYGTEVADTTRVGDCIMAHPGEKEYFISMKLCEIDHPENVYESEKVMTLSLSNGGEFQPGLIYNIYIKVMGVTKITMDAVLEEWKDAPNDDNLNFDIF